MSFFSKQFIDILQWPDPAPDVLSARYPMEGQEIQTGAKLVVRETQAALFLNEGRLADLFGAGTHTLTTQTLPVLTYLMNWDKGFQSPFKSDVFFFNLREQLDQKWGTTQPITVRDKEFGPLRIRAFGNYAFKISDPKLFWTRFCGSGAEFRVADIDGQLRTAILTGMASFLGSAAVAFVDMAAQQGEFSRALQTALAPVFTEMGLALTAFYVQSLSLPEELERHLDRAGSQRIVGNLNDYTRFQAADALGDAASQPGGGLASEGVGLGAGLAVGQMMAGALNASLNQAPAGQTASPDADPMATLEKLGELYQKGILTEAEFTAKKAEILNKIK